MTRRILHVVGGMNRGGAETWLMHVLRHIDRERFHMDFLVHTTQPCAYDEEIRQLGSQIIPCAGPSNLTGYVRNLTQILRDRGPYDGIHSHVYLFSGVILPVAAYKRIPVRIAHIYPTEDRQGTIQTRPIRSVYRSLMAKSINRYATDVLFDSEQAQQSFINLFRNRSEKYQVVCPSIDLTPYQEDVDVETIKHHLHIPAKTRIILNVSRYVPHKNHRHLIKIAQQVVQVRNDVVFLLVGDGPGYQEVRDQVEQLQLTPHFHFIRGLTSIVPLFKAADLFLFPSLMEGFGIVLVEAAASGLPIVASRIPGILESSQASPNPALIEPNDTTGFVRAILDALKRPKSDFAPDPSLLRQFDISSSIGRLINVYGETKDTQ